VVVSVPERVALASLPSPLQRAKRLGPRLGLEDLFIKRDDLTGFSLGGNKIRKLEFLIADALAQGADTLLVMGGPKSNLCEAAAAAARVVGMACEVILYGDRPNQAPANLALAEASGAVSWFTGDDDRSSVDAFAERRAAALRLSFVSDLGGPWAALSQGQLRWVSPGHCSGLLSVANVTRRRDRSTASRHNVHDSLVRRCRFLA